MCSCNWCVTMVELHLVTGGTGAGKTTYARKLAEEIGAARFSIDEWMTTLFWMDSPDPMEFEWTIARIERCETQIREQVAALIKIEVPSVLDLGFTKADHRRAFANFAQGLGARPVLHHLNIAPDVRWDRVNDRNIERGDTYRMHVDRSMFDFMEGEWEAPDQDELRAVNGRAVR
jgi:predicted kinase